MDEHSEPADILRGLETREQRLAWIRSHLGTEDLADALLMVKNMATMLHTDGSQMRTQFDSPKRKALLALVLRMRAMIRGLMNEA